MKLLDQVVFIVDEANQKIQESRIRDVDGYIDMTTTPLGVASRFHVRAVPTFQILGEVFRTRELAQEFADGNGLDDKAIEEGRSFELWTWGTGGQMPKCVSTHPSNEAAIDALEATFYDDFWACDHINAFTSHDDAQAYLDGASEERDRSLVSAG